MDRPWLSTYYLLALLCGVAFVACTGAFSMGWLDGLDRAILQELRGGSSTLDRATPLWSIEIMRDVTSLAGVGLLCFIGLLVLVYLGLMRRWRAMLVAVGLIACSQASVFILKQVISRPRPDLVEHGAAVHTQSFPSGHATLAASVALLLAWTAARHHGQKSLRAYFWVVGVGAALLIGFSRLYLGMHWFSDVLAGLLLGGFWACLFMGIGRSLQHVGGAIDAALAPEPTVGPTTDRIDAHRPPPQPQPALSA